MELLMDNNNTEQLLPIHLATLLGNIEIVLRIIKYGVDVFVVDSRKWTVMHYAAMAPARVISVLVEMPAFYEQLRHVDINGCSPIHIACITGQVFNVQRLMIQGLTAKMLSITAPKQIDNFLEMYIDPTPFVTFTLKEVTECLDYRYFLYAGCPLHWASCWTLLNRLLDLKVFRINLRNSVGDTPLISFVKRIINLLPNEINQLKSSPKLTWSVRRFSKRRDDRLCWLLRLITCGARINSCDNLGNSALHYAALDADVPTVQMLLIFGARVNIRNNRNESPLHMACVQLEKCKFSSKSVTSRSSVSSSSSSTTTQSSIESKNKSTRSKIRTPSTKENKIVRKYKAVIKLFNVINARKCHKNTIGCTELCSFVSKNSRSSSKSKNLDGIDNSLFSLILNCKARIISNTMYGNGEHNSNKSGSLDCKSESSKSSKVVKKKSKIVKPDKSVQEELELMNLLALDGGYSESGIKPLIQALLLNELQRYLTQPLQCYFKMITGSSYGTLTATLLTINRTPKEIFYFFLQLRESFRTPLITQLDNNTIILENYLKKEIGEKLVLGDMESLYNRYLLLITANIYYHPVKLTFFSSFNKKSSDITMPMWKVCRACGTGLGSYKTFTRFYDASLLAPNPTFDAMAYYHNYLYNLLQENDPKKINGDKSTYVPFSFVISVGSGRAPVEDHPRILEIDKFQSMNPTELVKNFNYFRYLKDIMFHTVCETDVYVCER